jgi:N-acetylneuraminate lyase
MSIELIAAPHSPLDSHGSLRLEVVSQQASHFQKSQVAGVFICGSTGEGVSLMSEERMQLAEAWAEAARQHALKLIVHVGHNSGSQAAKLASHAQRLQADGVAVMAPSFFKPSSPQSLLDYLKPIAGACKETPFYFYDIPSLTGVCLPTPAVLPLLAEQIPNFAGIKYTKDDLMELQECLDIAQGRWPILFGSDEILLAAYTYGVRGAVGSTYNFIPQLYHKMIAALDSQHLAEARRLQLLSIRIIRLCQSFGYLAAAKTAMQLVGIDCGPVRPPLPKLTEGQTQNFLAELKRLTGEI